MFFVYCRISQIPVLVYFFKGVLLQPLEAALVLTNLHNLGMVGYTLTNRYGGSAFMTRPLIHLHKLCLHK